MPGWLPAGLLQSYSPVPAHLSCLIPQITPAYKGAQQPLQLSPLDHHISAAKPGAVNTSSQSPIAVLSSSTEQHAADPGVTAPGYEDLLDLDGIDSSLLDMDLGGFGLGGTIAKSFFSPSFSGPSGRCHSTGPGMANSPCAPAGDCDMAEVFSSYTGAEGAGLPSMDSGDSAAAGDAASGLLPMQQEVDSPKGSNVKALAHGPQSPRRMVSRHLSTRVSMRGTGRIWHSHTMLSVA